MGFLPLSRGAKALDSILAPSPRTTPRKPHSQVSGDAPISCYWRFTEVVAMFPHPPAHSIEIEPSGPLAQHLKPQQIKNARRAKIAENGSRQSI